MSSFRTPHATRPAVNPTDDPNGRGPARSPGLGEGERTPSATGADLHCSPSLPSLDGPVRSEPQALLSADDHLDQQLPHSPSAGPDPLVGRDWECGYIQS